MNPQLLSVLVTTDNNADTLARCLDSVAFAELIVGFDSGSNDDTRVIAERRVIRLDVSFLHLGERYTSVPPVRNRE